VVDIVTGSETEEDSSAVNISRFPSLAKSSNLSVPVVAVVVVVVDDL
jgi:hypothetical protein